MTDYNDAFTPKCLASSPFLSKLLVCVLVVASVRVSYAQVGIGTQAPEALLDVQGAVRITSLPSAPTSDVINLGGISTASKLNTTAIGANLTITTEGLATAPVARTIGRKTVVAAEYDTATTINNLDLLIDAGEDNELATFIYMTGYSGTTKIDGFTGGTEGRRMTLYFGESSNVTLSEQDAGAASGNKIITLAVAGIGTSGVGLAELVYDADAISPSEGAWLVLKFRD